MVKSKMLQPVSFLKKMWEGFETVARIFLLSGWRNILKHPDLKTEEKCILIGNGPSFRETLREEKEVLRKSPLVCVNMFCQTDDFGDLKPRYYIISAPIFFLADEKISEFYLKLRDDLFQALKERTAWEMFIMVPFVARKSAEFKKILAANNNIKAIYFNNTPAEGLLSHFFFKTGLGIPRPHNVLIPAIMNLINLNFKEIRLIGADHSWLPEITVNDKNEALVSHKHFYDENESKPMKMEDYIVRPRRLHEIIHKFYLSFRGYWEILPYAAKKNVKIYNCSRVSMIDAFERKSLSDD